MFVWEFIFKIESKQMRVIYFLSLAQKKQRKTVPLKAIAALGGRGDI
jgi:hypothetical protein